MEGWGPSKSSLIPTTKNQGEAPPYKQTGVALPELGSPLLAEHAPLLKEAKDIAPQVVQVFVPAIAQAVLGPLRSFELPF